MDPVLKASLAAMSEAELLKFACEYDELTEEAKSLLREEFSHRKLEPPLIDEKVELGLRQLVTLRQFRDPVEAQLAHAALESAGIESYLRDENIVRIDWWYSNVFGGIRLQVSDLDYEAAEAVLSQPTLTDFVPDDGPAYLQPECPQYKSLDIRSIDRSKAVGPAILLLIIVPVLDAILMMFLSPIIALVVALCALIAVIRILGLPLPSFLSRSYFRCNSCGCSWIDEHEGF